MNKKVYIGKLRHYSLELEPSYYILRSIIGNKRMTMYGSWIGAVIDDNINNQYKYELYIDTVQIRFDRHFIFGFEI